MSCVKHAALSLLVLAAMACRTDDSKPDTGDLPSSCTWYEDADGDGFGDAGSAASGPCTGVSEGWVDNDDDCDDGDPEVHPDADERCNGIDDDCDGDVDEDAVDAVALHVDADGDGFGDPDATVMACEPGEGVVEDGTDCDDGDATTYPGAPERCDGLDNDCDGELDEDLQETWYADVDGDGFGDAGTVVESCDPGVGWVADDSDCDDDDAAVFPGAEEACNGIDDDCDGEVDEGLLTTYWADADGDGFGDAEAAAELCDMEAGYSDNDEDCDDSNSSISPDGSEICNGLDDDCDGLIDDEDPEVTGTDTWYVDADGDGYGLGAYTTQACDQPSGYAAWAGDCDDGDAAYNPGATEDDCTDPADYNCDGSVGYVDADGDGFAACEDCDDGDGAINPDATELCDGVDNDCDGSVDEADAADAATWYADGDGDGYGDAASTATACDEPSGFVADDSDCDDGDAAVFPGAAELCNGVDDDCDGSVDEGVTSTWYVDSDGDGYGDAASTVEACSQPSGTSSDATDCDDGDASVNPAAAELCDGADNDCDGSVDEASAADAATWYRDRDEDGYGDAASATVACEQPSGYVADAADCDDFDNDVNPGADELCDGGDNDCDGAVDEDDALDATTWYADVDGDGYGDPGSTTQACDQPSGFVADDEDCDDGDAAVNPVATEACDGLDNDCDGLVDDADSAVSGTSTWYVDYDGDGYGGARLSRDACDQPPGYVADWSDCDDSDAAVNPGGTELCNGYDDDCDGLVDDDDGDLADPATWYADADGDGYGDAGSVVISCEAPSGYVADATDCDDGDAGVNPGAAELCDGVDDDCDGTVDEADAIDASTWYADGDGDGYGDASAPSVACSQPSGTVADSSDCDDGDGAINPGATELCNGVDDDCDGLVDDDDPNLSGEPIWYADSDGDGYGNAAYGIGACSQPSGYVADGSDCDDGDAAVNPAGVEICDGVDDDCDGLVDDDDSAVSGAPTWYYDADGDGYGDAGNTVERCEPPSGYGADATDCDDGDGAINPGVTELCDGMDNDCDGAVDEDDAADAGTWYADSDGDSYGDAASSTVACEPPSGSVADASDCDDGDAAINPAATDACDYTDNDCDGSVDEGYLTGGKYTLDTDCGSCGNDCSTYSYDNATAACDSSARLPWCAFTCDAGWYDADGASYNGCECGFISATDDPFDGVDADCDGSDGDPDDAVHVSVDTGSSSGTGSLDDPLDSVQDGIDLALTEGKVYVLVAEGTYEESIHLAEGLTLYGGWDTAFDDRDPTVYLSVIEGTGFTSTHPAVVTAVDITAATVFEGFQVYAWAGTADGSSAIAMWIEDCSDALIIAENLIEAGEGRAGADGVDGDDGTDGADGDSGTDGELSDCTALTSGGAGGSNSCDGVAVDGGFGGDAVCPSGFGGYQGDGEEGYPSSSGGGAGSAGCDGYISSSDCYECMISTTCWDGGVDGGDGADGTEGSGGAGATDPDGAVSAGTWVGEGGAIGGAAEYGTGGGGGGAGSGAYVASTCGDHHLGGTGGGGGAGGCAGLPGSGGQSGGASIGVLFSYSGTITTLPVFSGNTISAALGGQGGDGGDGGPGGVGGWGGYGGDAGRTTAWCGLEGGDGGTGGDGGGGGGGGGGAGGPSFAAWVEGVVPDASYLGADNSLGYAYAGAGGRGGLGGDVSTSNGDDGVDGDEGEQNW
jgi:hypothetical protein